MINKLLIISTIAMFFSGCVSLPVQRSISVTVGDYHYPGNNQLDVSIQQSNEDPKEAEKETSEKLDAISMFLDEKGFAYTLNASSTFQERDTNDDKNRFISRKSLSVLVNDDTNSEVLMNELQELGATDVYMNVYPAKEGDSIQEVMDTAKSEASEIAETLGVKLGQVLTVNSQHDSGFYIITFEIAK